MVVSLRKVKREDWDFILKLRNNKESSRNFYDHHIISKKEHYAYLKKQKRNPNFINRIICLDSNDVGYIRILDGDISIMIQKKRSNKGIGTKALRLMEKEAKKVGITKLIGRVMTFNKNSQKIFEKNDYKLHMFWYEKDI